MLENYDGAVQDFKSAIHEASAEGSTSEAEIRTLKTELKQAELDLKRSKTKDYYKILGKLFLYPLQCNKRRLIPVV